MTNNQILGNLVAFKNGSAKWQNVIDKLEGMYTALHSTVTLCFHELSYQLNATNIPFFNFYG